MRSFKNALFRFRSLGK